MKNPLARFVPKPLRLTRLFSRAKSRDEPRQLEKLEQRRGLVRYVPIQIGGQFVPFIVDTGDSDRRRDPYD